MNADGDRGEARSFLARPRRRALAIGVGLRLSHVASSSAGARARGPLDSDDDYHLRRARFAAAHFPRTILFDPLMNFPRGRRRRSGRRSSTSRSRRRRGCCTAPRRSAGSESSAGRPGCPLALRGRGDRPRGPARRGALAGAAGRRRPPPLFVAVCPGHILWSQYGHTDQHVAESFFGLAGAPALPERAASEPRSPGKRAGARRPAGVALALAVLAWQGAIYWGAIIALSLFLEAALDAATRPPRRRPDPGPRRPL